MWNNFGGVVSQYGQQKWKAYSIDKRRHLIVIMHHLAFGFEVPNNALSTHNFRPRTVKSQDVFLRHVNQERRF